MKTSSNRLVISLKQVQWILLSLFLMSSPLSLNAANTLYWGAEASGTIHAANLDGSSATPLNLYNNEAAPCGVAINTVTGKIYWTNFHGQGVRVANLDGSGTVSTLFPDEGSLCGVAINPASGKIYWANFTYSSIRVGNLDGTGVPSILFQESIGAGPSGVAIDPASNKIYWSNQFSDEIRVGNLDGSGLALTLVSGEDNPIGVAVDPKAGKIYWAALNVGTIRAANVDGTGVATLYSEEVTPGGVAIDPSANKIYWASFTGGKVRTGNLNGTGSAVTLYQGSAAPLFPVLLKAPISIDKPSISGGAKLGKILKCNIGWAPDLLGAYLFQAPRTIEYQWYLNGNILAGAQQDSYEPTVAGSYTCKATATNQAGTTTVTSPIKKVK